MRHLQAVPERMVDAREMASILRISVPTLNKIRREAKERGDPMPEMTYGRRLVRYHPGRVIRWLEDREERAA